MVWPVFLSVYLLTTTAHLALAEEGAPLSGGDGGICFCPISVPGDQPHPDLGPLWQYVHTSASTDELYNYPCSNCKSAEECKGTKCKAMHLYKREVPEGGCTANSNTGNCVCGDILIPDDATGCDKASSCKNVCAETCSGQTCGGQTYYKAVNFELDCIWNEPSPTDHSGATK